MVDRKGEIIKSSFENNKDYNPDKIIEKVNNHKRVCTPNLSKMSARPFQGPFPLYMQVFPF